MGKYDNLQHIPLAAFLVFLGGWFMWVYISVVFLDGGRPPLLEGMVMIFLAVFFFLIGIKIIYNVFTEYNRTIQRFIKTFDNEIVAESKVEYFLKNAEIYHGIQVNEDFIFLHKLGKRYCIARTSDVVWMHKKMVSKIRDWKKVGETNHLVFYFVDRSEYTVDLESDAMCNECIEKIAPCLPNAVIGYSPHVKDLYYRGKI